MARFDFKGKQVAPLVADGTSLPLFLLLLSRIMDWLHLVPHKSFCCHGKSLEARKEGLFENSGAFTHVSRRNGKALDKLERIETSNHPGMVAIWSRTLTKTLKILDGMIPHAVSERIMDDVMTHSLEIVKDGPRFAFHGWVMRIRGFFSRI